MNEIIFLHFGQAGVQLGNSLWELFTEEHGIDKTGKSNSSDIRSRALFDINSSGIHTPRAIFFDFDPMPIDQIRGGDYKQLFHAESLISGKEDASNNYIRAHYTLGRDFSELLQERVRKIAENCDRIEGFIFTNSLGGATGSGISSLILDRISVSYLKVPKAVISIYPSPNISTSVVEPYNALLGISDSLGQTDMAIMLDNEALYRICSRQLQIEMPIYTNINRLVAQSVSAVTSSLRFGGSLNTSLADMCTNLVPYSRLKHLVNSYAPLSGPNDVERITYKCFEKSSFLASCDPSLGQYLACCLLYRGDVVPKQAVKSLSALRSKVNLNFVDWTPTGFKTSINHKPPHFLENWDMPNSPRAASNLVNTTAVTKCFEKIAKNYDSLYSKRAFVHWYVGEGLSEGFFSEARENLQALICDYREVGIHSSDLPDV